jgi:hypothetical protein
MVHGKTDMPLRSARSVWVSLLAVCAFAGAAVNSSAQESAANSPAGCPVTKPTHAFTPPPPYKGDPPTGTIFFGTLKLWTLVWLNAWQGRKLVWWSPGNDRQTDSPPGLTVTLTPLDSSASPLITDHSNWASIQGRPAFITTGMSSPPIAGCWEVTGRLDQEEVKYVVWLGPRP